MRVTKRLRDVGTSLGIVIDKTLLRRLRWDVGTELVIEADVDQRVLVVSRVQTHPAGRAAAAPLRATAPAAD